MQATPPERENLEMVLWGVGTHMRDCAAACIAVQGRSRQRLIQIKTALRDELSEIGKMLGEDGTAPYLDEEVTVQLMTYRAAIERAHNEVIEAFESLTVPSI